MWKIIFFISALIFVRSSHAENQTNPVAEEETTSLGSRINQGVYLVYKHILDDERLEVSEFLDKAAQKIVVLDEAYTKMFEAMKKSILRLLERFQFVDNNIFNVDTKFGSYLGRTQNEFGILQRKIKNIFTRIQAEFIAATNDVIDIMVQHFDHVAATKCWKKDKKNVTKSFNRSWDIIKSTVNDETTLMTKEVNKYANYIRSKLAAVEARLDACLDDECVNDIFHENQFHIYPKLDKFVYGMAQNIKNAYILIDTETSNRLLIMNYELEEIEDSIRKCLLLKPKIE